MKSLWELLWDYDPNGLVVMDRQMIIRVVNPAFCHMFKTSPEAIIATPASALLEDTTRFQQVWESGQAVVGVEHEYPQYNLYVREVIFPVPEEGMVAGILVDLTDEWQRHTEIQNLRHETILKVHSVVDKQMKVAQQIAGLLGETTAETKASLLKLLNLVEK